MNICFLKYLKNVSKVFFNDLSEPISILIAYILSQIFVFYIIFYYIDTSFILENHVSSTLYEISNWPSHVPIWPSPVPIWPTLVPIWPCLVPDWPWFWLLVSTAD